MAEPTSRDGEDRPGLGRPVRFPRPRRGWGVVLAGFVLVLAGGCATQPAPGALPRATEVLAGEDLGETLRGVVEKTAVPGMAAVVLRGDRIVAHGAAGVRRRGSASPVTLADRFELCSATKAMTATVAARLVESGCVRWDSTLGEAFGAERPAIDPRWRNVTLRQLLAQCAGLAEHPVDFLRAARGGGDPVAQRADYTLRVLRRAPTYAPGARGVYANTSYLAAAVMLERAAGRSWEMLVADEVFRPLGIASAGFGPPGNGRMVDEPWGHGAWRLLYFPLPGAGTVPFAPSDRSADFPRLAAPAGLVHMNVLDWARFVSAHLRGDPANPHAAPGLVRADSFAELHRVEPVEFRERPAGPALRDTGYALGWFVTTRGWAKGGRPGDQGRVLFHLGENGRWTCAVWVAPELDLAILVACNRGRAWGPVDTAVGELLRRYRDAMPP